ncbi:hypothetical protein CIG19_18835 [Enterobacterales bacterium CwR94]|nr:hypothetical protein CIG19_18835 [Enterobacterales bacterium CwR94]
MNFKFTISQMLIPPYTSRLEARDEDGIFIVCEIEDLNDIKEEEMKAIELFPGAGEAARKFQNKLIESVSKA